MLINVVFFFPMPHLAEGEGRGGGKVEGRKEEEKEGGGR